jgi:hypothetical protein
MLTNLAEDQPMTHIPYPANAEPKTKTELLARIRAARAALELALAQLDEDGLMEPGPDGWSIKDHLFHLSAWLRKTLAVLQGQPGHEALGVPQSLYNSGDTDGINARLHQQSQLLRLADVQAVFHNSHHAILDLISTQPESWLSQAYSASDADDHRQVMEAIASNTYEHDEEHRGWIEARLKADV